MKKVIASLIFITALSGCSLLDAYLMANFDSVEYSLVNKINTLSELSVNECKNGKKSHENFESMYVVAIELKNYSQYIPRNEDTSKLAGNLVELTKQAKEMYDKGADTVSEGFCKLKSNQINRATKTAQEAIGKKPR